MTKKCPECGDELQDNGLMAWCVRPDGIHSNAHVFNVIEKRKRSDTMTKEITLKEACEEINRLTRERDALSAQLAEAETGRDQALDSCFSWSERAKTAEARADPAEKEVERLGEIITECDGVECVKHDTLVCGMLETRLAAESAAQRMRSALEAVEWVSRPAHIISTEICAWCKAGIEYGHKPTCQRQLALAREGCGE